MSNYPDGAGGWVAKCDTAGLDVDGMTDRFLAELREQLPTSAPRSDRRARALIDSIIGAAVLSEGEIDRWENRHHEQGKRHGRKAA